MSSCRNYLPGIKFISFINGYYILLPYKLLVQRELIIAHFNIVENLQVWFNNNADQINSLDIEKHKFSKGKIIQLLEALKEVQGIRYSVIEFSYVYSNYLNKKL